MMTNDTSITTLPIKATSIVDYEGILVMTRS